VAEEKTSNECYLLDLGLIDYKEALNLQEKFWEDRFRKKIKDVLMLLEHHPVFTVGMGGNFSNILVSVEELKKKGIAVYRVDRGGDVTYHGPGQLIGYPILDLKSYGLDIHSYVWKLEESIVKMLKEEYGLNAEIVKGFPGIWVRNKKIAAIGIRVKSMVTKHGFALNVNPNMKYFKMIVPCGLVGKDVTSMAEVLGREISVLEVKKKYVKYFAETFDVKVKKVSLEELLV
jgi:lipoate-protein ligase B